MVVLILILILVGVGKVDRALIWLRGRRIVIVRLREV